MTSDATSSSKLASDLEAMIAGTYAHPARAPFDFKKAAIFAGAARCHLDCEVELLPGLHLRPTYVDLFASAMAAFAPPPTPRAVHPAPWHAVDGGGTSEAVRVEIHLAENAQPLGLPHLDTLRIVAALMRLLTATPICLPILSSAPLDTITSRQDEPIFMAFEVGPLWRAEIMHLGPSHFEPMSEWLTPTSVLLNDDDVFHALMLADGFWWIPSGVSQMMTLWTVAETLIRPKRQGVGASMADYIRTYLGRSRGHGDRLYNEVIRLYSERGSAAHAGRTPSPNDVRASFMIIRDIFLRCFVEQVRPPHRENVTPLPWR